MSWKRKAGFGCGGLALLLLLGIASSIYFGLFIPAVQVVEPGETGRRITDAGLLANYYPGRGGGRRPAVMLLGGSEGGLTPSGTRSALALQAEGYSVLHLSYYRAPGQSSHLELIPLEYFTGAISWLQRQPGIDAARIGIIGASKGAEAALLVATRDPRVRAVVAAAPSSVAWQGSSFDSSAQFDSSWSEEGRPLAHLQFGGWRWWRDMYPILSEALTTLPQNPGAAIPVERTGARVLLICGEEDRLWPACPMARQLAGRARAHRRDNVTILAYPDAGHPVFGQPVREGDPGFDRLDALGGTDAGTNQARAAGWRQMMAFLKRALAAER
jgi:hypothetical protein